MYYYREQEKTEYTFPEIPCIKIYVDMLLSICKLQHKDAPYRKEIPMEQDYTSLKEHYINAIVKMLNNCNDISLIDLIKKLLEKSV